MDKQVDYLSVTEAADLLGVSVGRVRQLLIAGDLKGHKLGEKAWAIHPTEVARRRLERNGKQSRTTG